MPNIKNLKRIAQVSSFRKLAAATWPAPGDPTIYGQLDLDITAALDYLKRKEKESGEKITVTHLVGRCLAQCFREYPAANTIVRLGRFYQRETVDMFFQVAITGKSPGKGDDLSGVVVRKADTLTVPEIARQLRERARKVRRNEDKEVSKAKNNLQWVPGLALRPMLKLVDFLSYELNLDVPGMPRDPFGTAMVTSMGMFGIARAWAPLFPPSHCPMVLMVGAIERRPWVMEEEGKEELVIRPCMTLCVAMDHRVIDGVLGAMMTKRIRELMLNPDLLDELTEAQRI
ncbi:MAG: 2-oxo acid dehydrogenase subunit E2 [Myxococcota bacterium]